MKARIVLGTWLLLVLLSVSLAFSMSEPMGVVPPPVRPTGVPGPTSMSAPFVMSFAGDTTWIQVHNGTASCPGGPNLGHGGEATGGPGPRETWCFEEGPGDSCGTNPPWTTKCFTHVDVRTLPSQTGINFWHIDSYRTNQRTYCGSYALWCGSAAQWQGQPVECGTWKNPPGYGNQWNCYVQLSLPLTFNVAHGCTLFFDPRYDTECKYDYFYVDYWNGTTWTTLATFNATSNNHGAVCGAAGRPNPDYWGNSDTNRLTNCNWQARTNPNEPAFKKAIAPGSLIITSGPKFRWRFTSDGAFSDADGRGDTDGAAFIDNVWVRGDNQQFTEDFESGVLNPAYWSFPRGEGVLDAWHISHDPDPPYEGGDGGSRTTCEVDSSYIYRARPEQGYPTGKPWRNGWYYMLMTPSVPIQNSGCLVQYDSWQCTYDPPSCDYTDVEARFFDSRYGRWCPWVNLYGRPYETCLFPNYDANDDVSKFYGDAADSMQFCWEIMDASNPGDLCRGRHQGTEFQVDNVSVGFYDITATQYSARGIDILHDSFLPQVDAAYNSFFDPYSADSINWYKNSAHPLPRHTQLYVNVGDKDGIATVRIKASINNGATWITKPMTMDQPADPAHPSLGGSYYGTVKASDFTPGATAWAVGTECWYYVLTTDSLANQVYFPARANPAHPGHDGTQDDYFSFTIFPQFPASYQGTKLLLVDGHERNVYDWAPCLSNVTRLVPLQNIYEQTLTDAGYCYDKFDINGAASNQYIQPIWFTGYDAVIWFTGPYFDTYLFGVDAQRALRDYLGHGGKVVLCGDRIAYEMAPQGIGDDSLGGEFLSGIMGSSYLSEMPSGFNYPYVYAVAESSVNVFGHRVAIGLDTLLVYRDCPYLKDMSYVLTKASPPAGYTAQRLMHIANPTIAQADEAIYTEYQGVGQCVYVNFDLSASVNHVRGYCDGTPPSQAPDFNAGRYDGRVELMRVILEDIFGLPPSGGGVASVPAPTPKTPAFQWSLAQNVPNPTATITEIRYEVAHSCDISIRIYNATGQLVRTLVSERKEPGRYAISWDATGESGERVSSGVYFYKIDGAGFSATKKMLVVR